MASIKSMSYALLVLAFAALMSLISAGGGRDFYYKTKQTHPHTHKHPGGHRLALTSGTKLVSTLNLDSRSYPPSQ